MKKHILITGPANAGKTTLAMQTIGESKMIEVQPGTHTCIKQQLARKLNPETEYILIEGVALKELGGQFFKSLLTMVSFVYRFPQEAVKRIPINSTFIFTSTDDIEPFLGEILDSRRIQIAKLDFDGAIRTIQYLPPID